MEAKKNPKANLERYRNTLIILGICLAGAVTATALESVSFDTQEKDIASQEEDNSFKEFDIPIPEIPEPPEPEPEPEIAPVVTLDNVEETKDEDLEVKADVLPDNIEMPIIVQDKVEKVEIFEFPQQTAEFPGGQEKMYEFLRENMKYPPMAKDARIQGKVFVQFVVWTDGSISDVNVLKGIGGGCDEEAIRVIKSMPKWAPAE